MKAADILSPSQFAAMFPNAGPGAIAMNRKQWEQHVGALNTPVEPKPLVPAKPKSAGKPRGRAPMNKTEGAFWLLLQARQQAGEFVRVEREGITLRWPDGMRYTPDFVGWRDDGKHIAFETKGGHIWEKDATKFRAARAAWPWFAFEMHQLKRGHWERIL